MLPLSSLRPPLLFLLVASAATAFSACGGTSINHEPADAGGTSGQGGTGTGGTGGSTSGTGGTTGGAGGGITGGTAGSTSGASGTSGTSPVSCDDIRRQTEGELESIQRCMTDAECGQVLEGTSCGCTRDLVARFDADATAFHELSDAEVNGEICNAFSSTCDCPTADGFVCAKGRCAWNYVKDDPVPMCTSTPMGSMCVVGNPIDSGDELVPGMPLELVFRPSGCFSSSCTEVFSASCGVKPDGDDFYAVADMCLTQNSDPTVDCTADCGGGGQLRCPTQYSLTEGTHTVHLAGAFPLDVTFTVPSVVNDGSLCAAMDL